MSTSQEHIEYAQAHREQADRSKRSGYMDAAALELQLAQIEATLAVAAAIRESRPTTTTFNQTFTRPPGPGSHGGLL